MKLKHIALTPTLFLLGCGRIGKSYCHTRNPHSAYPTNPATSYRDFSNSNPGAH